MRLDRHRVGLDASRSALRADLLGLFEL